MANAEAAMKLRVLSRALQTSLTKHSVTISAGDALDAVLDLQTVGFMDPCSEGCMEGCKDACKSGCKDSSRE